MTSRKDIIRAKMEYLDIECTDEHSAPRFHHVIYKRSDCVFDKCIIGDSITFGCARKNCITYCFPGAKIEHLYTVPSLVKTMELKKVCIYLGTNNLLDPRNPWQHSDQPDQVLQKYKLFIEKCLEVQFQVTICPLFGIQNKKLVVNDFNKQLISYAKGKQLGICSMRDVSYNRDIGDTNKNEMRDGIHSIPDRIMKIASVFTF